MSSLKHFDIVNYPRHETLRLMAGYLQSVIEQTDKMPETRNELTRFHAKSIPTIDIMAYLNRILKYAPCENDCFLSVLVYFNHMATLQNKPPSFVSSCKKRRKPIIINSYNIHRLLIIGIMIAAKFYSDIFFTNSHYAKVGGLPVLELNQLEIEFLLINDFDLHVSVEEIQETGDLLISHALKYPLKINVNPINELKIIKPTHKQNVSSQKQQKDVPVPPRIQFNEAEETNRRVSIQPQPTSAATNNNINNNRPTHSNYNIQFTNSPVPPQPKHSSSYDDYNKELVESTAAAIDSFDVDPIPKFTTLSAVASMGNHRSPIPNVYTLARTTSKSASAKLRNSMIMSMNSNIPLSSSNNNNNNNNNSNNNTSSNYSGSLVNENIAMNNRYSYKPPTSSSSQPSQPQVLKQNHPVYQTPQPMPQSQPPNGVLMESQYIMYEAQQKQQQNEMMKKYNETLRMNNGNQGGGMMYKQKPNSLPKNYYISPEMTEAIPMQNNLMNNGQNSYSTGDLYNSKRTSTGSSLASNPNIPVYKHPSKSKSSSSLNVVNDWHNKELPPIKIGQRTNSSGNLNSMNGNPHSANDILYQPNLPPKNVVPLYNNSPIKMANPPPDKRNNRLSTTPYMDSPLEAPPRLSKFFGYMPPNEIISPIKITDDFQQELQKMEDMNNNFYLSPLNSQSTHSPSINQAFSNLHIGSNASSASNTPLRSFNSTSNVTTPNGSINTMMDPSLTISPLAAKASALSLSPSTPTNNRPFSINIDPNHNPTPLNSLNSPVSAKINKRYSIQTVDRPLPSLPSVPTHNNNNNNNKRYSTQPISLQQPPASQQPLSINTILPRSLPNSSNDFMNINAGVNYNEHGPMSSGHLSNGEAFPLPNNMSIFMNKPTMNNNYR